MWDYEEVATASKGILDPLYRVVESSCGWDHSPLVIISYISTELKMESSGMSLELQIET